jgi:diguanylate cyclase (GGDEF)-like protein/PAS domain S-box-containing protein
MGDGANERLGPEAYHALYEDSPNAVFFTLSDGRVTAANRAASKIFRMTETEICARGHQGLADPSDERWALLLAQRERTGSAHGAARMIRSDGALIEVEMSTHLFIAADGEERACTVFLDVTGRVAREGGLAEETDKRREFALSDELTGLRNRRGFVDVASQILEMADRQQVPAHLLFVDVDHMKELNDRLGHDSGDAALKAVSRALTHAVRRADLVSRIGGDEFAALTLGLNKTGPNAVEARLGKYLGASPTVAAVGAAVTVSVGWAVRAPGEAVTVEDLLENADQIMCRTKAMKFERGRRTDRATD